MWYVYILRCADDSFYTGCTGNLDNRIAAHCGGEVKFTSTRLPVKVETVIRFSDRLKAFQFEKYLKSGSGIAFRNKRLI